MVSERLPKSQESLPPSWPSGYQSKASGADTEFLVLNGTDSESYLPHHPAHSQRKRSDCCFSKEQVIQIGARATRMSKCTCGKKGNGEMCPGHVQKVFHPMCQTLKKAAPLRPPPANTKMMTEMGNSVRLLTTQREFARLPIQWWPDARCRHPRTYLPILRRVSQDKFRHTPRMNKNRC